MWRIESSGIQGIRYLAARTRTRVSSLGVLGVREDFGDELVAVAGQLRGHVGGWRRSRGGDGGSGGGGAAEEHGTSLPLGFLKNKKSKDHFCHTNFQPQKIIEKNQNLNSKLIDKSKWCEIDHFFQYFWYFWDFFE